LIFDGAVSAACSLTRTVSSSRPLSMARMAVMIFVVLAGGRGCDPLRSQITSPLVASMMIAARAVRRGPSAAASVAGMIAASTTHTTQPVQDTFILILTSIDVSVENASAQLRDYPCSAGDAQAAMGDSSTGSLGRYSRAIRGSSSPDSWKSAVSARIFSQRHAERAGIRQDPRRRLAPAPACA